MSHENVETFRRGAQAINHGDTAAVLRIVDPSATWEPLRAGVQGVYRGHEGMREFLADTAESFESFQADFTDVRDLGDDRVLGWRDSYPRQRKRDRD
jgi:SnoaL-like domain